MDSSGMGLRCNWELLSVTVEYVTYRAVHHVVNTPTRERGATAATARGDPSACARIPASVGAARRRVGRVPTPLQPRTGIPALTLRHDSVQQSTVSCTMLTPRHAAHVSPARARAPRHVLLTVCSRVAVISVDYPRCMMLFLATASSTAKIGAGLIKSSSW